MQMTITITGGRQVRTKLKRLGSSLYNFTTAMRKIGDDLGRYYANQGFNSQGGVFGRPWAPLARSTVIRKTKLYPRFANFPLLASEKMRNSFVAVSSSRDVIITNRANYFKYHQSTAPRTKIPRRQTMGINDPVKRLVRDIIRADVRQKIRSA